MQFGDVVFEGGKGVFSGAIRLAQYFLPGKDHRITHAMIVVGFGLVLEADPVHGVHFRTFEQGDDLNDVLYVMRPKAVRVTDEEARQRIYKASVEAFLAFLGEDYSFKQILLHKLDIALTTEMPATLGATFCSALVKRVLTLAGLTEDLSRTLLMSPSELHAELSAAPAWTPVSLEDFGRVLRGPTESDLAWARRLGLSTDLSRIVPSFNEKNRMLIETFAALASAQDALARATFARSQVNLLHNAHYPFDMIEEAGAAQRWDELGKLIGRVRWTIAASQSLYKAEHAKLAHRLRSALPRVVEAMHQEDPNLTLFNEFKALFDANDVAGLTHFVGRIGPYLVPGVTELYAGGRDALAEADDPVLHGLGQAIEVRLNSINGIEGTAELLAHLLCGDPKPPDGTQH